MEPATELIVDAARRHRVERRDRHRECTRRDRIVRIGTPIRPGRRSKEELEGHRGWELGRPAPAGADPVEPVLERLDGRRSDSFGLDPGRRCGNAAVGNTLVGNASLPRHASLLRHERVDEPRA